MLTVRKSEERGRSNFGWLKTFYTFSFANYYDPRHMHFRHLRVINQDQVAPHTGFDMHPHENMEIFTYVYKGQITHRDSLGSDYTLYAGDIQIMSAGTGVVHSEHNLGDEPLELLQIWLLPERKNIEPRYANGHVDRQQTLNNLHLIVSSDKDSNALWINQNCHIYSSIFEKGHQQQIDVKENRFGWLQLITGELKVNDVSLKAGDGLSFQKEKELHLTALEEAEFLFFDLA